MNVERIYEQLCQSDEAPDIPPEAWSSFESSLSGLSLTRIKDGATALWERGLRDGFALGFQYALELAATSRK